MSINRISFIGISALCFSSNAMAFDMYLPAEWSVGFFIFGVVCAVVVIIGLRG